MMAGEPNVLGGWLASGDMVEKVTIQYVSFVERVSVGGLPQVPFSMQWTFCHDLCRHKAQVLCISSASDPVRQIVINFR